MKLYQSALVSLAFLVGCGDTADPGDLEKRLSKSAPANSALADPVYRVKGAKNLTYRASDLFYLGKGISSADGQLALLYGGLGSGTILHPTSEAVEAADAQRLKEYEILSRGFAKTLGVQYDSFKVSDSKGIAPTDFEITIIDDGPEGHQSRTLLIDFDGDGVSVKK